MQREFKLQFAGLVLTSRKKMSKLARRQGSGSGKQVMRIYREEGGCGANEGSAYFAVFLTVFFFNRKSFKASLKSSGNGASNFMVFRVPGWTKESSLACSSTRGAA